MVLFLWFLCPVLCVLFIFFEVLSEFNYRSSKFLKDCYITFILKSVSGILFASMLFSSFSGYLSSFGASFLFCLPILTLSWCLFLCIR